MVRSLWTAASGMNGQQFNIDTISNNISNVNTVGYKQVRAEFEDLIYQTQRIAGTPATEQTVLPEGLQVGHGVKVAATQRLFEQGAPQFSGVESDIAVVGEGFFRVRLMDGSVGYTRDGEFKIDSNGQFVTSNGYRLDPPVILPEGEVRESLTITDAGKVSVKIGDSQDPTEIAQITLFRFTNPAGLEAIGENLFKETNGSGDAMQGQPGEGNMGVLKHKFVERSNVSIVKEMVNMIVAQRAYELNSKAVQTSDAMLGIANNLKR